MTAEDEDLRKAVQQYVEDFAHDLMDELVRTGIMDSYPGTFEEEMALTERLGSAKVVLKWGR